MNFKIIFSTKTNGRTEFNMEGTTAEVKTFIKLKATNDFDFAAVENLDPMVEGDVERWLIQRNRFGELDMKVFSFYETDPNVNINAAWCAKDMRAETGAVDKLLGGGKF